MLFCRHQINGKIRCNYKIATVTQENIENVWGLWKIVPFHVGRFHLLPLVTMIWVARGNSKTRSRGKMGLSLCTCNTSSPRSKLVCRSKLDILCWFHLTNSQNKNLFVLELKNYVEILLARMKPMIRTVISSLSVPGMICCGWIFNKLNPFFILWVLLFNLGKLLLFSTVHLTA